MLKNGSSLIDIYKADIQHVSLPGFGDKFIDWDVLRLDKIHPVISGNKWFKLKYYLQDAIEKKAGSIITFGGAWSNHIIATACLCKDYGLKCMGLIRGESPAALSYTLQAAKDYGMAIEFVSRDDYAKKTENTFVANLLNRFPGTYIIPEGGAGLLGSKGSEEILSPGQSLEYSHIACCIGTGTMYEGIVKIASPGQEVIGIPVLKGLKYLPEQFADNDLKHARSKIFDDYHFGGYAKKTPALIAFMNYFYAETGIPTDFVYTGKLMFALSDLISKNYFCAGSKILAIHSGGLQGNNSLPSGTLIF